MSKFQGSIVVKLADQQMPDDFIEKMLEINQSVAGFAVAVEDGEKGIIKVDGSSNGSASLGDVKGIQEDYLDSTCIFFFGKFPDSFNEENVQPFPAIVDEAQDHEMVVFMDGNFDEKAIEGSKNSAEYDVFSKFLKPALVRIWKGADKDIHATMEEISTDPGFAELIGMWYKGRGTIVLLASNGEMITFGENALTTEYDWGWTSNPCGYGEKTVITKVVDTVKRGFSGRASKGADATKSPTPTAIPRNVTASGGDDAEKYHAPPLNWSKKEKGDWYLEHNESIIPPGYKSCPLILKMEYRKVKSLKDLGTATAANKRPIADVVPVRQRGKTEEKAVTTEVLPVIPPTQLKKLAEFMKMNTAAKNVNEGRNILDPERYADFEKKYTTFAQAAGMKGLEETFPWIFEQYVKVGKDVGIEALALLALNLSVSYQRFLAAEDDPTYVGKPEEEPEEEVNTEVVNDPPPTRRGFGGNRKLG